MSSLSEPRPKGNASTIDRIGGWFSRTGIVIAVAGAGVVCAAAEGPMAFDPVGRGTTYQDGGRYSVGSTASPQPGSAGFDPTNRSLQRVIEEPAISSPRRVSGRHEASSPIWLEWRLTGYGSGIGLEGMQVADLDDDGDLEMVASASPKGGKPNDHWFVFDHDGIDYSRSYVSDTMGEPIVGLRAAQLDTEGTPLEIVLALAETLQVYDGRTLSLAYEFPIAPTTARGFEVANLDSDQAMEAVFCDRGATQVYDLESGRLEYELRHIECLDLAVGEVDGTAGLELVVAAGDDGFVLDAETGAIEWYNPMGFGDSIAVGDLDGDSLDEIVVGFAWGGISVWNGDAHNLVWQIDEIFNLDMVVTGDVEGDGHVDVIYGDRQHGGFHVLDGATGEEKWGYENPGSGFDGFAIGDVDDDGIKDVLFSYGHNSTQYARLVIVDSVSQTEVWSSPHFHGPFPGLAEGDVDADGVNEIVFTSHSDSSGYGAGRYYVYDVSARSLEFVGPDLGASYYYGAWDVELANVDSDPQLEIIFPTGDSHSTYLLCLDGSDHSLEWQSPGFEFGVTIGSVEVADIDHDGSPEILTGKRVFFPTASDRLIHTFDGKTGNLMWESPELTMFDGHAELMLQRVADIDGDGISEVIAAHHRGDLFVLDTDTGEVELETDGLGVSALELANLDLNGLDEIVVGTTRGTLGIVDAETGMMTEIAGPFGGPIDGLAVVELSGDDELDFVFVVDGRVFVVLGDTMKPWWVSGFLGIGAGEADSLLVRDFDRDGRMEIWVNMGEIGLAMFEVRRPDG